ncbi:hypothetical protein HID58_034748, partial [Brassica napus]
MLHHTTSALSLSAFVGGCSVEAGKLCGDLVCSRRFSEILCKGLWSLCSIATLIVIRVCVSSLAARVEGLFSDGFFCLR